MITEILSDDLGVRPDGRTVRRSEYYWLSSDEKPIEGVDNADIGYEMDTKKVYLFDEQNQTWIEQ